MTDTKTMYLDLMRRSLTRYGYDNVIPIQPKPRSLIRKLLISFLGHHDLLLARIVPFDARKRNLGLDLPRHGQTMIGMERLSHLQWCVETVLREGVPGDLMECGVWRGGASILMRAVLAANGDMKRDVWLADSFAGLPPPDVANYPEDRGIRLDLSPILAVPEAEVRLNFERYGLLDERVHFLRGWFKDTLPNAPVESIAVLRLDGDLYGSTIQALEALYPRVSAGGFCVIDDYHAMDSCKKAVTAYREACGITAEIAEIDGTGVYWRKPF